MAAGEVLHEPKVCYRLAVFFALASLPCARPFSIPWGKPQLSNMKAARDPSQIFRPFVKRVDDLEEEEDDFEYARVRRRGGREYQNRPGGDEFESDFGYQQFDASKRTAAKRRNPQEEGEDENFYGRKARQEYYDDEDYYDNDEDDFDVDEFLNKNPTRSRPTRPLSLDLADPGNTIERWPELFGDTNLLRDVVVICSVIWVVDFIADLPVYTYDPPMI